MQNNILFDNIYIGHSVDDAKKLAQETFFKKLPVEQFAENADKPKEEEKKTDSPSSKPTFKEDPVKYITEKVDLFITIAKRDPIQAIKFVPEVAGGFAAVLFSVLFLLVGVVGGGSAVPATKKAVSDVKDKAKDVKGEAKAAATGADTGKSEASKRNTRSQN